jgi:DNA-directed RNA polymerase subunit RPC12/RpoP
VAATLTADGELTFFSFPIEKAEETAGGDLIVYGKATDGSVDSDLQIVDPDWSAKAIQEWLDTGGNLRVQHQARRDPAGRGLEVETTPDGHYVKALVVEPVAKDLVRKGVLTSYSIGVIHPDIHPDPTGKAMNGIITGRHDGQTKISEISLVDRGSNFNSRFQLVKAAGDGAPEFVGKMLGDVEVDADTPGYSVTVTNEADVADDDAPATKTVSDDEAASTFTPGDLAKMLARKADEIVEKRDMDAHVGGGVDRDKIPAEDFAGKNRSFPIVTPGDVSDAASSIGRAGEDNYPSATLKKNIISIARRKGSAFVAELPEAWRAEMGADKDADAEVTKTAGGVEMDDVDEADDVEVKAAGATVEKKDKVVCPHCGANVHAEHKFCPECGGKLADALSIQKNHDYTCLDCGRQLDKGEKFCPGCGTKNPGYLPEADNKVKAASDDDAPVVKAAKTKKIKKAKKAKKAGKRCSPADGVEEAADTTPAPAHREPDGPAVEEFETDADMTDGDEDQEMAAAKTAAPPLLVPGDLEASAAMRLKMLGAPLDYGILHDLTCPGYHPDDVAKAYPRVDLASLDVAHWQAKAFDMAASAPLEQARQANELWQHVATLKATDPRYLMEARSELYKAFRDANPGPGTFPTPGAPSARSFTRPVLDAGHQAPSPAHDAPRSAPAGFGSISAADYTRGYLTAGHAEPSPSAARGQMQPVSVPAATGVPTRTYYSNAARDNARQAMLAMHDHIAATFPDLCPVASTPSPYGDGALPGSRPVPVGVGMPAPHGATKATKKAKKGEKGEKAVPAVAEDVTAKAAPAEVAKAAVLDADAVQELIDKAVSSASAAHDAEVKQLRKQLKKANKMLDALAAQPDPNGPYRGVAFEQISKTSAAPEVLPSVSRAERAQANLFQTLHHQWRNDPDPMQREVAWRELTKMSGIANTTYK